MEKNIENNMVMLSLKDKIPQGITVIAVTEFYDNKILFWGNSDKP